MRRSRICFLGTVAAVGLGAVVVGCYPTTEDVNTMARADHDFVAGEHQATRDLMTDQHGIQDPAAAEAMLAMNDNFSAVVQQLRERVDVVEATGPAVGLGGVGADDTIPWLLGLFNLGWLYPFIKGFGKSRASDEVAQATADITGIKLDLATAAKGGAAVPSDGPGWPT